MTSPIQWSFRSQLQSIPESKSHGTLILRRNSSYIFLDVDGFAAFKSIEGFQASFRLPPGEHKLEAIFYYSTGYEITGSIGTLMLPVTIQKDDNTVIDVSIIDGMLKMGDQMTKITTTKNSY